MVLGLKASVQTDKDLHNVARRSAKKTLFWVPKHSNSCLQTIKVLPLLPAQVLHPLCQHMQAYSFILQSCQCNDELETFPPPPPTHPIASKCYKICVYTVSIHVALLIQSS